MLIAIVQVVICFVLAVKVPALLSSKVLAPRCRPTGSIKRSWHLQCVGGRRPNRPKVS